MSAAALDRRTTEALLELTRLMGAAASGGDWERVASHDAERRALLEREPTEHHELPPAALVEALRDADRELIRSALDARAALGRDSRRVRTEREVRRAYAGVMQSASQGGTGP